MNGSAARRLATFAASPLLAALVACTGGGAVGDDSPTPGTAAPLEPAAVTALATADAACIDRVMCIRGYHFDPQACSCVPDADEDASVARPDAGCIQRVMCTRWDHFDRALCRCVPDDAGAGEGDACSGT